MKFSETFIKRPIMTVLIFFTLIAFGVGAYFELPVNSLPSIEVPVIQIVANYPGASPETMASSVASPIENECMQIQGLQSIMSQNTTGQTVVTLVFDTTRSIDAVVPDVQAAISRAQGNLPDLPSPPTFYKNNPNEKPIMYLSVGSDTLTGGQLYDIANKEIAHRISMINGVSKAKVYGAKRAIRVKVNPEKLAGYGLTVDDIASALKAGTSELPGGGLNGKYRTFTIQPKGQLKTAEAYANLVVKYKNGAPVRIKDIGTVTTGTEDDVLNIMYYSKNKKLDVNPIVIAVQPVSGANTVKVAAAVKGLLNNISSQIPGSVRINMIYDGSTKIIESIDDVQFTLVLAMVLVVLVIFLFLGRLSDTIIPAVVLPVSVICTFLIMYISGFSLNNLTLMGLTLAIGFVVDDAIVVLENTVRLIQEGQKPLAAAINSAKNISGTILSMTLSLVTVFVPLVFMGGVVGGTFREFALTVVVAVVCSGIISLTLTPMMCARMLVHEGKGKNGNNGKKKKFNLEKYSNKLTGTLLLFYGKTLKWVLKHKYISVLLWVACIGGTFLFYSFVPKTFLPPGDSGVIFGGMLVPLGTSTVEVQKFQKDINEIVKKDSYVDHFFTMTGIYPGADQSTGFMLICLKPENKRPPIATVVRELRAKFSKLKYPLGFTFLQPIAVLKIPTGGDNAAMGTQYAYTLTGNNTEEVYKYAQIIENKMRAMPGFVGIQNSVKLNMPQLNVDILRKRASTFGITASQINNTLSNSFAQGKTTTYTTDTDIYDVILELEKRFRENPVDLSKIKIYSSVADKLVPLSSVARWNVTVGPQEVDHYQQQTAATISFNLKDDVPIGTATTELENVASKILPSGVNGEFQGEAQEFQKTLVALGILIFIAIFLMYVVLGILYESYIHPFTVLTTLPVAAFGGVGTLLLFNSDLSLYAYVGMFMLLGIVAKNGIMMVDCSSQLMREGQSGSDAIYNACIIRFRPILMTGLAAIMGAVPLAIGVGADAASRRPLGLVIVGGLIFSQVITLYVTPGIYLYMENFQEKVLDRFELTRSVAS